jgi:hypothetical protein
VIELTAGVLAAVFVIAPWAGYNASRFKHPEILSAQSGLTLSAANCDSTYYGPWQGYFDIQCTTATNVRLGITNADDESVQDVANRREALRYVRHHLGRFLVIEPIRLLRLVGLYKTNFVIQTDHFVEGRELWIARWGLYSFWALGSLAIGGAISLRRRREVPLYPLMAPIAALVIAVLATYASTRFRAIAEPVVVVLAAVAIDAALTWLRGVGHPAEVPPRVATTSAVAGRSEMG